jgi:HEPN domain-containing protein
MSLKYIREWKAKAEQDYQAIIILARQRKKAVPDIICYHAHQCAEKYLKALLVKHALSIPKTHDLVFLADKLKKQEPELELIKGILRQLNGYAVELRYPGESATKKESNIAFENVKEIRKFLLLKIP